jgi:hypothetical protein
MASLALVGAPFESMLTAAGDAWSEFVLEEGDGWVYVFVSTEVMDKEMDRAACPLSTAGNGAVSCRMYDGAVYVNGGCVRLIIDWRDHLAPGESVRVRYVAATRMVSVVLRGRSYDLATLPATADIAHMRFGVAGWPGSSVRVMGAARSSGVACAVCDCGGSTMLFTRRVCLRARATQRTTSCRTCDSSCSPA